MEYNTSDASHHLITDPANFIQVSLLSETDIPNSPGIYVIKVIAPSCLPKIFEEKLINRNTDIVYIGKASSSLRTRLWKQELHGMGNGTFFRSIGAILGFTPPQGSLIGKKRRYNYRFSQADKQFIIKWIDTSLSINYITTHSEYTGTLETALIKQFTPIINIEHNPSPLHELKILRNRCIDIANTPQYPCQL